MSEFSSIERQVAREAKAMTREEVIMKAIEKRITWLQAAENPDLSIRTRRIQHRSQNLAGTDGDALSVGFSPSVG